VSNPEFLLCDTDALIQVFIGRQVRLLVHMIDVYGVMPAIVPEVESEISAHRKFRNRFEPQLITQLAQQHIVVLEDAAIRQLLVQRGVPQPQIDQGLRRIVTRSQQYHRHVQTGEAYSHAAGVELRIPLMSHDWDAVRTLEQAGEPVAVPVLRLWDLFALALNDGVVTETEGDQATDHLEREDEFIPGALRKSAGPFAETIRRFDSRLRRRHRGAPADPAGPRDRLYLDPKPQGS
jgi:hypothetical protein